jgi:hypothetical protein
MAKSWQDLNKKNPLASSLFYLFAGFGGLLLYLYVIVPITWRHYHNDKQLYQETAQQRDLCLKNAEKEYKNYWNELCHYEKQQPECKLNDIDDYEVNGHLKSLQEYCYNQYPKQHLSP